MELCRLLSKDFNSISRTRNRSPYYTIENSIINLRECITASTAYMSVAANKYSSRATELLEYMSLIRYASKYHKG